MPEQTAKAAHFAAQLAALREQFAHQLGGTLDEMVARADGHDASGELLRELHGRLHKLAGSGGTFGFTELSRQARVLEVSAKTWLDTNLPAKDAWTTWLADLQALRQSIAPPAAVRQPATQPPTHGKPRGPVRIALIEDDPVYGETLQLGLSLLGYEVTHHAGFSAAESAILADPPDILVAAMMEQLPAIPKLFERMGQSLPTLFLAAHSDFAARLAVAEPQVQEHVATAQITEPAKHAGTVVAADLGRRAALEQRVHGAAQERGRRTGLHHGKDLGAGEAGQGEDREAQKNTLNLHATPSLRRFTRVTSVTESLHAPAELRLVDAIFVRLATVQEDHRNLGAKAGLQGGILRDIELLHVEPELVGHPREQRLHRPAQRALRRRI